MSNIENLNDELWNKHKDIFATNENLKVVEDVVGTNNHNLLDNTFASTTMRGIDIVVNDDKSITCNGTATERMAINLFVTLPAGDYIASGVSNGTVNSTHWVNLTNYINSAQYSQILDFTDGDALFNLSETTTVRYRMVVEVGATVNTTFYPMIRNANITDNTYKPFNLGLNNRFITSGTSFNTTKTLNVASGHAYMIIVSHTANKLADAFIVVNQSYGHTFVQRLSNNLSSASIVADEDGNSVTIRVGGAWCMYFAIQI